MAMLTPSNNQSWLAFDPSGDLSWAMELPFFGSRRSVGMDDGGILVSRLGASSYQMDFAGDDDTAWVSFHLVRLDATGGVLWAKHVERQIIAYDVYNFQVEELLIHGYGNNGGFYVLSRHSGPFSSTYLSLFKFDAQGEMLWERTIGEASSTPGEPLEGITSGNTLDAYLHLSVDDQENINVEFSGIDGSNMPVLFAVSGSGNLIHITQYDVPSADYLFCQDMVVDAAGGTCTACQVHLGNNTRHILLLNKDVNGVLGTSELVSLEYPLDDVSIARADDGSVVVLATYTANNSFPLMLTGLIHVDAQDSTARFYVARKSTIGNHDHWDWPGYMQVRNDTVLMQGIWFRKDQQFGVVDRAMSTSRFPLMDVPNCTWKDSSLARTVVPAGLITQTDLLPDYEAYDATSEWTAVIDTTSYVPVPLPLTQFTDRCNYFTGVPEAGRGSVEFGLFPSPVHGGGRLYLSGPVQDLAYRILDASGRNLFTGRTHATHTEVTVVLPGLASGLYIMQLLDVHGRRLGQERFVVE